MKFVSALALAVGSAVAQKTTTNDCFEQEGAVLKEECSSLFYNMCEAYIIDAEGSCNVMTYSDSQINWFSSDLYVVNWFYIDGIEESVITEDDTSQENEEINEGETPVEEDKVEEDRDVPCVLDSEIPTQYTKGTRMQIYSGLCGFKYQITNLNVNATYTFEVLRDGAVTLAASSAVAVLALAMF